MLFQTVIKVRVGTLALLHTDAIPHLRLAVILTVATGYLVIGVYLDAEVLAGIADEQSFLLTHQLVEALAFIRAVGDDGLAAANT